MTNKKLLIIGDSSFADIAYEYYTYDSQYDVVAFSVEDRYLKKKLFHGKPVVAFENIENIYSPDEYYVYVAIVYSQLNRLRTRLVNEVKEKGYKLASYISSHSFVWKNVEMGEHCFIFENNTIQPFVEIGNNVVCWSGNHIGHHSIISDNCFISSQVVISGHCCIGENTFLGVNSTIANNVNVGIDNWLSPGVIIMKDTDDKAFFKTQLNEKCTVSTHRFFKIKE